MLSPIHYLMAALKVLAAAHIVLLFSYGLCAVLFEQVQ
jgi:hypothetical protein